MRRCWLGGISACFLVAFASSGCAPGSSVTVGNHDPYAIHDHHHHGHGPPPHAPAHGHRHKHRHPGGSDLNLVFDSGLGVYVVVDLPNHYYWNGYYLRIQDGAWYASGQIGGRWEPRSVKSLPPGLRKKHGKKKKRGKGYGPARPDWD